MDTTVATVHGLYFLLTGVWPLLGIGSFQRVTGPKTDLWLVKTIGAVLAVIGGALLLAGARGEVTPPVVLLALGSALALAAVDVVYVLRRVIRPVYLLDATAELALVMWWLIILSA